MKMFLNYEYLRGEITALEMTAGRYPDQKNRLHVTCATPGSLHLFDLGFFKQEIFGELAQKNAYFISRLQHQTALYWQENDKESFDIADYLKKGVPHQVSLPVYLGQKARVPIRLVCQRLPPKVAAERKRKAKANAKQDGRRNGVSKRHLQLLEWAIFITNVPEDLLSVDQILLIYRLRWQIELIFKLWKSRGQLKSIGNWRPARVLCQIYARLIGLLLFHWLVAPLVTSLKTISLPKAFCRLQHHVGKIVTAISKHWRGLAQVLQRIDRDILRFAMQDKRKISPSTYQLLVEAGL